MFSQISYLLNLGVSNVVRRKANFISAVVITVACLVLISMFFTVSVNITTNADNFMDETAMIAFVDDSLTEAEAKGLEPMLYQIPNIKSVTLITREEALESFMDTYNTTSSYLQPSILRLRYSIELADASLHSETEAQIREIAGIADVRTDDTITDGFSSIKNIAIICGSVLAFIMIVSSALIMSNSIKLSMANRREELEIMSMVGAYDSFLYVPLFVEGIITGWVSSVIATILAVGIYACVSKLIKTTSIISLISLVPANELIGRLAIINILIGTIIGAIGTISACRKFLRSLECQI